MDIEIEKDQEMKTRGLPPNTTEDHFWHPVRSGFLFVFDLSFWLFPSSPSFCFPSSVLSPRPPLPARFPVKSPPCKVQNENHQKNPFFPFFLFYPFRLRTVLPWDAVRTNGTNGVVADLCTLLRTVLSFDSSVSYYLRRREGAREKSGNLIFGPNAQEARRRKNGGTRIGRLHHVRERGRENGRLFL